MIETRDIEAREVKVGDHVENLGGAVKKIEERGGALVLHGPGEDNSMMAYPTRLVRVLAKP